jgi:hypothetical protein
VTSHDDTTEEKKENISAETFSFLSHKVTTPISNVGTKMDTVDSSLPNEMPLSSSSITNTKMNKIFSVKENSRNSSSEHLNNQNPSNLNKNSSNNNNSSNKNNENSLTKYGVNTNNLDELDLIMSNLDVWGIDVFLIDQLTINSPLVAVTYTIFQV